MDSDHATIDNIANGTAIGSWKDRSASTNHATQGTASNRPTYVANGLNSKGVLNYTASQTSDITGDSTIRTIVSVLRQSSSQTAATKPFGSNIFATTSAGKFGLQRQGSGMIDSGSTSSNFAVVTLQMASVITPFMSTESRKEPERIQTLRLPLTRLVMTLPGILRKSSPTIVLLMPGFARNSKVTLLINGVLFLILPFHTHTSWQSLPLEELRF